MIASDFSTGLTSTIAENEKAKQEEARRKIATTDAINPKVNNLEPMKAQKEPAPPKKLTLAKEFISAKSEIALNAKNGLKATTTIRGAKPGKEQQKYEEYQRDKQELALYKVEEYLPRSEGYFNFTVGGQKYSVPKGYEYDDLLGDYSGWNLYGTALRVNSFEGEMGAKYVFDFIGAVVTTYKDVLVQYVVEKALGTQLSGDKNFTPDLLTPGYTDAAKGFFKIIEELSSEREKKEKKGK